MARPSEEFLMAWSSLSGDDPNPGWNAIDLIPSGNVAVRAGRRSPDSAQAILLGFPTARLTAAEKLPEGQGFVVERASSEDPHQFWLALTRRAAGSTDLFTAMACDVVGALDDAAAAGASESTVLRAFIGRVGAWQEFMRKGALMLGAEAEIGLVGELLMVREIIEIGVPLPAAVESWVGPLDGVQDFELGTGALEVKTTLSGRGFPVRIGSLEQLDDSVRQPLFIAGIRLSQTDTGLSLSDLIADIRERAKGDSVADRLLGERVLAAGYLDAHAERYVRRFVLAEMRILEVQGGFPRLTLGNVPAGVIRATYEIDLDRAADNNVTVVDALKRLGAL